MTRVVVTGMGIVSPIGNTVEEFWRNLVAGVSGIGPITAFDATTMKVRIAGEVKGFEATDWMDAKTARRVARFAQFAVAVSKMALADACLTVTEENAEDIAIVLNTGGGGIQAVAEETEEIARKGVNRVNPFFVPIMIPSMASCQPSILMGIRGPILTSVAACASGTMAVVEALRLLRSGEASVAIAGGTESVMHPLSFSGMANMRALSTRNDEPTRASRPFDRDRDGFVFGEGAGAIVMETEEHARRRGARVLVEVTGGSITGDAWHVTEPEPSGRGAILAMRRALKDARMGPADIDYICAHGTATPLNDVAETRAIKEVFGADAYRVAISSPKSMVGHLLGAAGAISTAASIGAIMHGIVPPTINLENADPDCDLDYVPNVARETPVRAAMANGFGFGGQNAVVIYRRPPASI
ncbi:MAG: beta-ketoacyl-ACP synthase II [Chloroflexota bacterium]